MQIRNTLGEGGEDFLHFYRGNQTARRVDSEETCLGRRIVRTKIVNIEEKS